MNFMLPVLAASDPVDHVLPHELFSVFGFAVSNHVFMAIVSAALVVLVFCWVGRRVEPRGEGADAYVTKGRVAHMFEVMCVFVREQIARPNLGHLTDKYIYYIWTVFFFILFCNVLGMIPFGYALASLAALFGASDETAVALSHWGGTATSNLSLNVPLAFVSLVAIVYIGVKEGGKHFFEHFAPVPFKPIGMIPLALMLVVLEVVGLLIKCAVLAMRLFGTMLAGHLALAALIGMIFTFSGIVAFGVGVGVLFITVGLALLELFIAMLQAFIFTFLTVLFIASGAVHEHEGGEEVTEIEGGAGAALPVKS